MPRDERCASLEARGACNVNPTYDANGARASTGMRRWQAAAVLLALGALASARAAAPDALVDAYMRKSGLFEQLAHVEAGVLAGIDDAQAQSPRLSTEQRDGLRRAAKAAFGADRLRRAVRAELAASLPVPETEEMLQWLDTPLGHRITALEEEASTADAQRRVAETGAKALAALPAARRAVLERMLEASGAADVVASIVAHQQEGVLRGLGQSMAPPLGGSGEANAAREALRGEIAKALAPVLLATAAVVYAPLSDAELALYTAMLELPSSRRVTEATGRALDKALSAAAIEFGRRTGDATKPAPATT